MACSAYGSGATLYGDQFGLWQMREPLTLLSLGLAETEQRPDRPDAGEILEAHSSIAHGRQRADLHLMFHPDGVGKRLARLAGPGLKLPAIIFQLLRRQVRLARPVLDLTQADGVDRRADEINNQHAVGILHPAGQLNVAHHLIKRRLLLAAAALMSHS